MLIFKFATRGRGRLRERGRVAFGSGEPTYIKTWDRRVSCRHGRTGAQDPRSNRRARNHRMYEAYKRVCLTFYIWTVCVMSCWWSHRIATNRKRRLEEPRRVIRCFTLGRCKWRVWQQGSQDRRKRAEAKRKQ